MTQEEKEQKVSALTAGSDADLEQLVLGAIALSPIGYEVPIAELAKLSILAKLEGHDADVESVAALVKLAKLAITSRLRGYRPYAITLTALSIEAPE